jgi:hypothetical protein
VLGRKRIEEEDLMGLEQNATADNASTSAAMTCMHRAKSNVMSDLLASSGAFLFPCTVEYTLICAAVLYMMWRQTREGCVERQNHISTDTLF